MLQELLDTYGYLALFVGTFLEGETIMLLSGYAAHAGYLNIYWVTFIGFAGTFCGDQLWYFVGRKWGNRLIERFPSWKAPTERAYGLLKKYDVLFILSFRFFYGVRNVSPIVIGMSGLPRWRYFYLNMIAAAVWAVSFALIGYGFGTVVSEFFRNVEHDETYIFAALALVGFAVWLVHVHRRRSWVRRHVPPPSSGQ